MIDYKRLKVGDKLEVSGMIAVGKYRMGHEKEGQDIPPQVENGAVVEVVKTGVDNCTVKTDAGKELVFSQNKGAEKLSPATAETPPQATSPKQPAK
jgi:hypothetical protein